ncbi:MAG: hypothetical protein ACR2K2_09100 [Mycobacteriales bacterium]
MSRAVLLAVGLGLVDALVAVLVVVLVSKVNADQVGWFAYAPLNDTAVPARPFPWEFVLLPVSLVAVNVGLAVVAVRQRWFAR